MNVGSLFDNAGERVRVEAVFQGEVHYSKPATRHPQYVYRVGRDRAELWIQKGFWRPLPTGAAVAAAN